MLMFFCLNISICILGDGSTKEGDNQSDSKNEDVYESISDEELDLFDENEEDLKLPKPASVMEVDWSLLSKMNIPIKPKSECGQKCKCLVNVARETIFNL